jgi:hypothetical protein
MAKDSRSFREVAAEDREENIVREFIGFVQFSKKWWLLPLLLLLVGLAAFMVLSSGAAAPFIYTLF